jgi:hypothetical protein
VNEDVYVFIKGAELAATINGPDFNTLGPRQSSWRGDRLHGPQPEWEDALHLGCHFWTASRNSWQPTVGTTVAYLKTNYEYEYTGASFLGRPPFVRLLPAGGSADSTTPALLRQKGGGNDADDQKG